MLLVLVLFATIVWPAAATVIQEDFKLDPGNGASGDRFGEAISVSGSIVVVAASSASPGGVSGAGAAYVFTTSDSGVSWVEQEILTASDKTADADFGWSCGASGDIVVVGAPYADPGVVDRAGAAYVYTTSDGGSSWAEAQILTASDKASENYFGDAVAASGDLIAVGAYARDSGGVSVAGAAYVFSTSDGGAMWAEEAILTASDKAAVDYFGDAVAISGSTLVVGASQADPGGVGEAGKVYVFTTSDGGSSWTEEAILTASDKVSSAFFGESVSVSGNILAVGAFQASPNGVFSAGAGYAFRTQDGGATWTDEVLLTASDKAENDWLGGSVAVSGDRVIVGAHFRDSFDGESFIFETVDGGVSWAQVSRFAPNVHASFASMGYDVALDAGYAFAGAPSGGVGSAYFALVGAVPGSSGDPVFVDFHGHRFLAGNEPQTRLLLFAYGRDRVFVRTGTVRGREHGYFLDALIVVRDGAGSATIEVVQDKHATVVSGDAQLTMSIAQGDNGLTAVSVANGEALLAVMPHVSNGFSFLNTKVIFASPALRAGCTGMLCDGDRLQ